MLCLTASLAAAHSPHCGYEYRSTDAYVLWYKFSDYGKHMKTNMSLCKSGSTSNCILATCGEGGDKFIVSKGVPLDITIEGFSKNFRANRLIERRRLKMRGGHDAS